MANRLPVPSVLAGAVAIAGMTLGCGGAAPSLPTPPAPPVPVTEPSAPTVTGLSPGVGSVGGDTRMKIEGAGFLPGATVTIGGNRAQASVVYRDAVPTILYVDTPAHPAGAVDVIVTNPTGQSGGLAAGYTYVDPESLNFNGTWSGFGNAGQDLAIRLTIENDALVSVPCDTQATVRISPPALVSNGAFSHPGPDGVLVSGKIVSESQAVGTLDLAPCSNTRWSAGRQ